MYYIDPDACSGCGDCVDACPAGAISLRDHIAFIDETRCTACGGCANTCPADAVLVLEMIPQGASLAPPAPSPPQAPAVSTAPAVSRSSAAPRIGGVLERVFSGLLTVAALALEKDHTSRGPLGAARPRGSGREDGRSEACRGRGGGADRGGGGRLGAGARNRGKTRRRVRL